MVNQAEKISNVKMRRVPWWLVPAILGLVVLYQVLGIGFVWDREPDVAEHGPASGPTSGHHESRVVLAPPQDHERDAPILNNAQDTRLPLTLVGVNSIPNSDISDAIIESNGRQRRYRVGATIKGTNNATLLSVLDDRVLIDHAGNIEVLHLRLDYPQSSLASPNSVAIPNDTSKTMAELLHQNRVSISRVIRIAPNIVDGEMRGIRVRPGSQRRAFAALGLAADDLVLRLNDTPLTNLAESLEAFESLDTLPVATMTVSRNETTQIISLDLQHMRDSLTAGLYAAGTSASDGDGAFDEHPD